MKMVDNEKLNLPNEDDILSEWLSRDHPERLKRECWRDHNQYREYHKTI